MTDNKNPTPAAPSTEVASGDRAALIGRLTGLLAKATPGPWAYDTSEPDPLFTPNWSIYPVADCEYSIAEVNGQVKKSAAEAQLIVEAVNALPSLLAALSPASDVPPIASSGQAYGSVPCQDCDGRGRIETGEMEDGPGGIGFAADDCAKCMGTGEITSDDHEKFGSKHGTDVNFRGGKQVVFFDYEGDGVFVWSFPYDTETDGQHCTEDERQSIYEQLWAWYLDWTSPSPEDDRCD